MVAEGWIRSRDARDPDFGLTRPEAGSLSKSTTVHVAKDFTPFVAGRYKSDGPGSGEALREIIVDALATYSKVRIDFDGIGMAPTSFLEEVFGGLARHMAEADEPASLVRARIEVVCSERPVICTQALRFFDDAAKREP